MIVYFIVCMIIIVLIEKSIRKQGENENGIFRNIGKFRDKHGNWHDFDYYYDEEIGEYEHIKTKR